jgi:phage terminase large subunit-like protein
VLGVDASWSGDSTGIVGCTVPEDENDRPHLFVVACWEKPADAQGWRIPTAEVEATIRAACELLPVVEVACDPFRFERSMQTLADEGLPMVEFRTNSLERMVPACQGFADAVLDGRLTHDGDPRLARHVANARVKVDQRGPRIVKAYKASTAFIDLAVCGVIAHARAVARAAVAEVTPEYHALDDYLDDGGADPW